MMSSGQHDGRAGARLDAPEHHVLAGGHDEERMHQHRRRHDMQPEGAVGPDLATLAVVEVERDAGGEDDQAADERHVERGAQQFGHVLQAGRRDGAAGHAVVEQERGLQERQQRRRDGDDAGEDRHAEAPEIDERGDDDPAEQDVARLRDGSAQREKLPDAFGHADAVAVVDDREPAARRSSP